MGYNLLINGEYWGYNPLTNHLLSSWDIQVLFYPNLPNDMDIIILFVLTCLFFLDDMLVNCRLLIVGFLADTEYKYS